MKHTVLPNSNGAPAARNTAARAVAVHEGTFLDDWPDEDVPLSKPTLVDLLDRVLEKGLVLHADIVISMAGVPLVGINLRALLAGIDTMTRYGVDMGTGGTGLSGFCEEGEKTLCSARA